MILIPDDPIVAHCRRGGAPPWARESEPCPRCGGELGSPRFSLEGAEVCCDCFCGWVEVWLESDPEEVADAMNVPTRRV